MLITDQGRRDSDVSESSFTLERSFEVEDFSSPELHLSDNNELDWLINLSLSLREYMQLLEIYMEIEKRVVISECNKPCVILGLTSSIGIK